MTIAAPSASASAPVRDANPLLAPAGELVDFAAVTPEHVMPAMRTLVAAAEQALEAAVALGADGKPATWSRLSATLDVPLEQLERGWNAVGHLQSLVDTPALRAAYNEALPLVTQLYTRLGADERLYHQYRSIAQADASLTPHQRRALELAMREFRLGGAELEGERKARFQAVREQAAVQSQAFSEHVQDATDAFHLDLPLARLDGLPDDARRAAIASAQAGGAGDQTGRLTLQGPSYLAAMRHLKDRDARRELHRAYITRASEFGPDTFDNSPIIDKLLALREEEASLLGMPRYADVSLARKMADSPRQVDEFLQDLAQRARPHALKDIQALREFAAADGASPLEPWDTAFYAERLREARYAFSEEEVKRYFTLERVLHGLFGLVGTLFDIEVREADGPRWHPDVRWFEIVDRDPISRGADGASPVIARFSLDLYARPGKRPGAWMSGARGRWLRPDGSQQIPVAHLVCNFAAPVAGRATLLTHDDVITLFHEFGHGLHHMLTRVDEISIAGINGVEWDAVELPSQFMENFCWERSVLRTLTAHEQTGEPLPDALFERMLAARNFNESLALLRQIEFALLDMRLHGEAAAPGRIVAVLDEVRQAVNVVPVDERNRFAHAFSHIFAGGYAAGYYSYKWAEVLSADAFSAFEEAGVLDPETGRRYRREILEAGASRPAIESFKAFRGREQKIDALLRHGGM